MMRETPRHPVPIVRVIIEDDRGQVLLTKRSATSHGPGQWCLPGGKVDYGETVTEAAKRELAEETGLVAASLRFVLCQDSLPLEPRGMHCINLYLVCTASGEPVTTDEACELAWVSPGDLERFDVAFRNDDGLRTYWGQRT